LVKSKAGELGEIGISVYASGKLSLDKEKLIQSSPSKLSKIFSSDSDLTQKIKYYSSKIYKASNLINLSTPPGISLPGTSIPDENTGSAIDTKA